MNGYFVGDSELYDLEQAVGQHLVYRVIFERTLSDRKLYMALPKEVANQLFLEPLPIAVIKDLKIATVVFDPLKEEIVEWTSWRIGGKPFARFSKSTPDRSRPWGTSGSS